MPYGPSRPKVAVRGVAERTREVTDSLRCLDDAALHLPIREASALQRVSRLMGHTFRRANGGRPGLPPSPRCSSGSRRAGPATER